MPSLANTSGSSSSFERRRKPNLNLWLGLIALTVVGGALFVFDPAAGGLYPTCMFHRLTGLQCPGCGGLRATHQLLHGHLLEAFHLNPFFVVVLLPVVFFLSGRWLLFRIQERRGGFEVRPFWIGIGLGAACLFGVLRNIL